MLMTPPRTHREWAVGVISTVVTGIGGGAIAVQYFGLQAWVDSVTGLVALGGLIFGCGLPGWAIVRWVFNFINLIAPRAEASTTLTDVPCSFVRQPVPHETTRALRILVGKRRPPSP